MINRMDSINAMINSKLLDKHMNEVLNQVTRAPDDDVVLNIYGMEGYGFYVNVVFMNLLN